MKNFIFAVLLFASFSANSATLLSGGSALSEAECTKYSCSLTTYYKSKEIDLSTINPDIVSSSITFDLDLPHAEYYKFVLNEAYGINNGWFEHIYIDGISYFITKDIILLPGVHTLGFVWGKLFNGSGLHAKATFIPVANTPIPPPFLMLSPIIAAFFGHRAWKGVKNA